MLLQLSISNIAVIHDLDIDFRAGLTVFTGETGAGKSILMDALGLVLGGRGESDLIRTGADQASISAVFALPPHAPVYTTLSQLGLPACPELILRRMMQRDGRSRAWVNDSPVSIKVLKLLGHHLLEIVGQYAQMDLLDDEEPQEILDHFANAQALCDAVAQQYKRLSSRRLALKEEEERFLKREEEQEQLNKCIQDLNVLDYQAGELNELEQTRRRFQNMERFNAKVKAIQEALFEAPTPLERIRHAKREVVSEGDDAEARVHAALMKTEVELVEAMACFESWAGSLEWDPNIVEKTEERFFAIKDLCRKYDCAAEELIPLRLRCEERLMKIDEGESYLNTLREQLKEEHSSFSEQITRLHDARQKAANKLSEALQEELPPLKLEKASFSVEIIKLREEEWNAQGGDRIRFLFSANQGVPARPLARVASGGELTRFLLALKLVLASRFDKRDLVFDEIDTGVGGATASAIGQRLKRLSRTHQVMAITHAPQVAAYGDRHLLIRKRIENQQTKTQIEDLDNPNLRKEELARMLAGRDVTDAARDAAESLLMTT